MEIVVALIMGTLIYLSFKVGIAAVIAKLIVGFLKRL